MTIQFLAIGKNHDPNIKSGIEDFTNRISKYYSVKWNLIAARNVGTINEVNLRKKEGQLITEHLKKDDYVVLLDGKGSQFTSEQLAAFIQSKANDSVKQLTFLIGGAFGIDDTIFRRSNYIWSLSQLTFPHQLVRLILAEQIYRACTILRNEKYHHS